MERNKTMADLAGGLLATKPMAEAQPAGARVGTKRKEATSSLSSEASDCHDRDPKRKEASALESKNDGAAVKKEKEGNSLWKEGEMLKLREEFWQAENLWMQMREKAVRGTVESKITLVPVPAVDNNKKRKLVRVIWLDACINDIIEDPCMMTELSAKQMKRSPKEYRQSYAMLKIVNAKKRAYHQALIQQHHAFGFAYDEVEVTDDDEEEGVKN